MGKGGQSLDQEAGFDMGGEAVAHIFAFAMSHATSLRAQALALPLKAAAGHAQPGIGFC